MGYLKGCEQSRATVKITWILQEKQPGVTNRHWTHGITDVCAMFTPTFCDA